MAAAAVALSNGSGGDSKAEFAEIYSRLKEEMLEDPAFEFTDESLQWIDRHFHLIFGEPSYYS